MRKNLLISLLLICALLLSLAGCAKRGSEDTSALDALKEENARLHEQIGVLTARLNELESRGFKTSKLQAKAWGDNNGATVTFSGEPRNHEDKSSALFVVRLNGAEVENVPCEWNGTEYTASVELEAADGYSYTCILVDADGTREQILLSSPDSPVYDNLVYMQSSLTAYCNLFINDWEQSGSDLKITSGFVQVQLPRITAEGTEVNFVSAQLVLLLNGNTVSSQALELPAGEGAGSHETALTDIAFTMPEMTEEHQLDLELRVKLSNGEEISAEGGSWYYTDGQLSMVVG